jgi:hypothetical protein
MYVRSRVVCLPSIATSLIFDLKWKVLNVLAELCCRTQAMVRWPWVAVTSLAAQFAERSSGQGRTDAADDVND